MLAGKDEVAVTLASVSPEVDSESVELSSKKQVQAVQYADETSSKQQSPPS